MKITVLENTKAALRFKLTGTNYTVANALRRIMINSVPSMAIDTVTVYENSSAMMDEYIAHRVGLVPITTPKDYTDTDEALFSLEIDGPVTVYSKDLQSSDKNVKIGNDKIPIIKLADNQRLKLDGKAVLKTAAKGAKYQPGLVTYKMNSDDEFEFYIETFGQIPATEILSRGVGIISNSVKEVSKGLKK